MLIENLREKYMNNIIEMSIVTLMMKTLRWTNMKNRVIMIHFILTLQMKILLMKMWLTARMRKPKRNMQKRLPKMLKRVLKMPKRVQNKRGQ